jgi:hypothetical protein
MGKVFGPNAAGRKPRWDCSGGLRPPVFVNSALMERRYGYFAGGGATVLVRNDSRTMEQSKWRDGQFIK